MREKKQPSNAPELTKVEQSEQKQNRTEPNRTVD